MLRWVVEELLLRLPAGMTIRADGRDSGHQAVLENPTNLLLGPKVSYSLTEACGDLSAWSDALPGLKQAGWSSGLADLGPVS